MSDEAQALAQPGRAQALLQTRPNDEERDDEREVRAGVDREGSRNADRHDRQRGERRADRASKVERHRVERHRGWQVFLADEPRHERRLRRGGKCARDPETDREPDHDPFVYVTGEREHGERRRRGPTAAELTRDRSCAAARR